MLSNVAQTQTNSMLPNLNLQLLQPSLRNAFSYAINMVQSQSQAVAFLPLAPIFTTSQLQVSQRSSGQRVQQSQSLPRRDVTSSVIASNRSTIVSQPTNVSACRLERSGSCVVSDPPKRSRRPREKPAKGKTPSAPANPVAPTKERKRTRNTSRSNLRKQKVPDTSSQLSAANRYKTELCRSFEESGACRYGEKCQFAHGRFELRSLSRHPKYKTELCRTFHSTAFCPYGQRCHFVHDEPREDFASQEEQDEADSSVPRDVQTRQRRATTQECYEPSCSTIESFCEDAEDQQFIVPSSLVMARSDDEGLAASCTSSTCSPVKRTGYPTGEFEWAKSVLQVSKSYTLSTSSDEDSGYALSCSNNDIPHSYISTVSVNNAEVRGATLSGEDTEEPESVAEEDEEYGDAFDEFGNAFRHLSLDGNNNVVDVNNNVEDVNNNEVQSPEAEWSSHHHSPARSRSHSQQDELEISVAASASASEKRLPIFASLAGTLR